MQSIYKHNNKNVSIQLVKSILLVQNENIKMNSCKCLNRILPEYKEQPNEE